MNLLTFNMEITGEKSGYFIHSVDHKGAMAEFRFHPENSDLIIDADGEVSEILKRNKNQLLKILKTKNIKTFFPGFNLRFVITDGKDVSIFNDMSKILLLDRRQAVDEICVLENGKAEIHEVFTDASFLEKTGKSGIAAIIKFPDGSYKLLMFRTCTKPMK